MHTATPLYRRHRFPSEIISHTVWLYFRFSLSYRDVEEIMAVRGIVVTYEAIRECASSSAKPSLMSCVEDALNLATSGTWMRCSSK
jgi:transposase-like protein